MPGKRSGGGRRSKGRNDRRKNGAFNPRGFSASQSLKARAVKYGVCSSDGSGVCAGIIPFDPSSGHLNVTEFISDWANLFTQYRLWGVRIRLCSAVAAADIETKSANLKAIVLGFQFRSTATLSTPSGYDAVLDNQPSRIWNVVSDTSPGGILITQKTPNSITYLETNATTSPGNAGAPGGFQYFGDTFTPSITIFTYFIEVFYQFRSRS